MRRDSGMLHPVALAALAVLVLNDHVWKARYPGWVTGKLSDVAVMGFDNWEVLTADARPPLTSMDMNLEEIGRAAARALFAALDGSPRSGLEALPCRIVIRGSTAPLG